MRFFLAYDVRSIAKNTWLINGIVYGISTLMAVSFFGATLYQINGWPRGVVATVLLIAAAVFISRRISPPVSREVLPARTAPTYWFLNCCVAAGYLGLALFLILHEPTTWAGSIFQIIPRRGFLLWGLLGITSLVLYVRGSLAAVNKILFGIFLFGFNALVFRSGVGFDIFVHEATVHAWMTNGFIEPRSFLYTGFYSVVAALATLIHIAPFHIITWLTPFVGACVLLFTAAWGALHTRREPIFFLLLVCATFSSLFTTSTPQALGHLLFLFLIVLVWVKKMYTPAQLILYVLGITAIHPLSGIPAAALVSAIIISEHAPQKFRRAGIFVCAAVLALLPAALIWLTTPDAHITAVSFKNMWALIFSDGRAFQSHALTRLAYIISACVPLAIFALAAIGAAKKFISPRAQMLAALSIGALISAGLLRIISIPSIIAYEQADFAGRLILIGIFFALPAVAETLERLRAPRAIATILIFISACSWFTAQTPWNTIERTKAINIAPRDFEIVKNIDEKNHGPLNKPHRPYIVLADQATSAAALHIFGFLDRQLPPPHTFYFYPIPTGDFLYSQFFLPQTYNGITRDALTAAARAAGVHDVYFVIKPYWNTPPHIIESLKTNTTDWWTVGGVVIGHLST